MLMSEMPQTERPREKLLARGAEALSDAELLAIFLRTGLPGLNAVELAQQLLSESETLHNLLNAGYDEFCSFKGVGGAKYVQLQAVIELSRRYLLEECRQDVYFNSSSSVRDYLKLQLKGLKREVFMALFLDSQHRLISAETLFYGTINAASVYPREVVKTALDRHAAAVILAHNHPSGVAEPSDADRLITEKLVQAMALVDIQVLDHFVVAGHHCVSLAERGML